MVNISKFGEDFLLLALRIDKHIKGYVDFYYGPENLRHIVELEVKSSPSKLLIDSNNLLNKLDLQGYDITREQYLEKTLTAMKTSIELLNGSELSIEDQFLKIYDVALKPANDSELKNLKNEYSEAYSGIGSLEKRLEKLRISRRVPEEKVFEFFKKALKITKNRTKELFINLLPENEQIILELTKETNDDMIKWTCYEWYLGNYRSKIEVNPKYNIFWTTLLIHSAHEGYPGHHTEFAVKELKLYRELNQFEHSILLLHSPKLIISEGIADLAINVLFSYREQVKIGLDEFCLDISKEDSTEAMITQFKVRHKLLLFWYNFAYHALFDHYNDEELISFGKKYELFSEDSLKNQIKSLNDPVYSKNAFMYNLGMNLITKKYGEFPLIKDFRNLLKNPILPSDLA